MKKRQILALLFVGTTTLASAQSFALREYASRMTDTENAMSIEKKTVEIKGSLNLNELKALKGAELKEEPKVKALYEATGALFMGVNKEGGYAGVPTLITPALKEVVFKNYSSKGSEVSWFIDYGNGEEAVTTLDEFNNALITPKIGLAKAPKIVAELNGARAEYDLTQHTYPQKAKASFWFGGSDIVEMSHHDPCLGNYLNVGDIENSEFRINKPFTDTNKKIEGYVITYDKPVGDLYVKSAYLFAIKNQETPLLAEGDTIYADFLEIVDNKLTNNVLGRGKCTIDNITDIPVEGGTFSYIEFPLLSADEFGYEDVAPITINSAFAVVYRGLGKKNVDISMPFAPAYGLLGTGYALLEDGTAKTVGYINEPETPMLNLNAGIVASCPTIEVIPGTDTAVFAKAGGKGTHTAKFEDGTTEDFDCATLISTIPYLNEDGQSNYEAVSNPEWITQVGMGDEKVNPQMPTPVFMAFELTADPLPEGEKGRYGEVKIKAQGQIITIICKQGDTTGIEETMDEETATSVEVLDVAGKTVGTYSVEGTFTLPSELSEGVYILKYNNGKVVKVVK